ncbi:MAG: hypothetical protein LBE25_05060 [Arthrobacter sp.]|nr:hypothetical protein [Arthrobacter sp.]
MSGVGFAGDWRGNTKWAVAAIGFAATQGIIQLIHVGDFGYTFERSFLDALEAACTEHDVRITAVRGNNDSTSFLEEWPSEAGSEIRLRPHVAVAPDRYRWVHGGLTFLALGGAGSIDRIQRTVGESWWANERLDPAIVASLTDPCDVVISHDCPDRVVLDLDPGFGEYFERPDPGVLGYCAQNRALLVRAVDAVRPSLLVHGHYHRRSDHRRPLPALPGRDPEFTRVVGLDCDGSTWGDDVLTLDEALGRS